MGNALRTAAQFAALSSFAVLAFGGVVIQWESGAFGAKEKLKSTVYLQDGKIRTESDNATGGKSVTIFDLGKQVLWFFQPEQGTYLEMNTDTVARRSREMEKLMKPMRERIASLPSEQRDAMARDTKAQIEALIATTPMVTFQAKGTRSKYGPFNCSNYEEITDGKRTAEICAIPFDQLDLTDADEKSIGIVARFATSMTGLLSPGTRPAEQQPGFPVHTIGYAGEQPLNESTVLSVEQRVLDASVFNLPPNLKKQVAFEIPRSSTER